MDSTQMPLEVTRLSKRLATLLALVGAFAKVHGALVPLEVARLRKRFAALLALVRALT